MQQEDIYSQAEPRFFTDRSGLYLAFPKLKTEEVASFCNLLNEMYSEDATRHVAYQEKQQRIALQVNDNQLVEAYIKYAISNKPEAITRICKVLGLSAGKLNAFPEKNEVYLAYPLQSDVMTVLQNINKAFGPSAAEITKGPFHLKLNSPVLIELVSSYFA